MPFDNEAFTKWLVEFEKELITCGMPEPQAKKFRNQYYNDAVAHFLDGSTPSDAAVNEIMGTV